MNHEVMLTHLKMIELHDFFRDLSRECLRKAPEKEIVELILELQARACDQAKHPIYKLIYGLAVTGALRILLEFRDEAEA